MTAIGKSTNKLLQKWRANQTLALLLVTLEQKTNQSKELQEIIDLLENEELPDARTGLEKSQNQLADYSKPARV